MLGENKSATLEKKIGKFRIDYFEKDEIYNKKRRKLNKSIFVSLFFAILGMVSLITGAIYKITYLYFGGFLFYAVFLPIFIILFLSKQEKLLKIKPSIEEITCFRISNIIEYLNEYLEHAKEKEIVENASKELKRLYNLIYKEMTRYEPIFKPEYDIKHAMERFLDVTELKYEEEIISKNPEKLRKLKEKFEGIFNNFLKSDYNGLYNFLKDDFEEIKNRAMETTSDKIKRFLVKILTNNYWRLFISIIISLIIFYIIWLSFPQYRQYLMSSIFSLPVLIGFVERILNNIYSGEKEEKTEGREKMKQITKVFDKMKSGVKYQEAVKQVAKELEILPQTVADKCCRQQGLSTAEFIENVNNAIKTGLSADEFIERVKDKSI